METKGLPISSVEGARLFSEGSNDRCWSVNLAKKQPITSALHRSFKLGALVGRVGTSVAGHRLMEIGRSDDARRKQRADTMVLNARRVVKSLGELKGAAMKVGQMLSLQESMLPPEVAEILSTLQKQAPRVPPEIMRYEVEGALGSFDEIFESMEEEAFAAASIGQVHRAKLKDGRDVAVKIQYPLIDQIVSADLKNLKILIGALWGLFSDIDFEPFWEEIRDRLVEELDYTIEAETMQRMAELWADTPEIIIPKVITTASTKNVLTMEFVDGLPPDEACSSERPQAQRDQGGQGLRTFLLRGLVEHRCLHADPNRANVAFREDGAVVVYDFGCVKQVPEALASGYADLMLAVLENRWGEIPETLRGIGFYKGDGDLFPAEIAEAYAEVLGRIVRKDPPYTFGTDDLGDAMMELGMKYWSEFGDMSFPSDAVFINRTFGGHVGNLGRLRATGPWREMIRRRARSAVNR